VPDYIVLLKPFEVIKEFYNGEFKGRRFPYYIVLLKLYRDKTNEIDEIIVEFPYYIVLLKLKR